MNSLITLGQARLILLTILFCFFSTDSYLSTVLSKDKISMEDIVATIKKGEYKKAISLLKKYNSQNPNKVEGYVILGQTYMAIDDFNSQDLAIQTFQEGLRRDPKNTSILQFLAELQENKLKNKEATRYLEKAANIDPTNFPVIEKLIENYITLQDRQNLQKLEAQVENWIKAHPDSVTAYLSLGRLYLTLGKTDNAIKTFQDAIRKKPDFTLAQRDLCEAYLMKRNTALFTETYYYWLVHERDGRALEKEYQLLKIAMPKEEAQRFDKLPYTEKSNFVVSFWRSHDPDPVTIQNEQLIEHFRRVEYAKSRFRSSASAMGFDDRGRIYIRWGPPEEKYSNPMPMLDPGQNQKFADMTNSEQGFTAPNIQSMAIRGNESWYYPSIDYYMAFDFVNYGGYYREVRSLADAFVGMTPGGGISMSIAGEQGGADGYSDWFTLAELYRERSHLGGIYSSIAGSSIERFATTISNEVPSEKIAAIRSHVPRYEVKLDIPPLTYALRPAQFRGDSGKTRIEIAYGLALNQLKPVPNRDTTFVFKFHNELVLFDSMNRRILHRQFKQEQVNQPRSDYEKKSFSGESICELLPGDYRLAFQMIETSNRKGSYNDRNLKIRDFIGNALMMSDLKLSPRIDILGVDDNTGREKLRILPYPFDWVTKQQPIFVYFEIYNLALTPDKKTSYEISLKMEREVKKGEYATELLKSFGRIFSGGKAQQIETSYLREGAEQTAIEYISLDLSGLNSGHSRLTVTVKDANLGKQTDNSVEFDLK